MTENVFVIPATIKVGKELPPYLPLADGRVKPTAECTREEVGQAIEECRFVAQTSRERLEAAYRDHVRDVEVLAQVSAYFAKYEQWAAVRDGGEGSELLWQVEL